MDNERRSLESRSAELKEDIELRVREIESLLKKKDKEMEVGCSMAFMG